MFGDGRVNDSPALVGEDDHHGEQPKRCGRHDEHVDGRDAFRVIAGFRPNVVFSAVKGGIPEN